MRWQNKHFVKQITLYENGDNAVHVWKQINMILESIYRVICRIVSCYEIYIYNCYVLIDPAKFKIQCRSLYVCFNDWRASGFVSISQTHSCILLNAHINDRWTWMKSKDNLHFGSWTFSLILSKFQKYIPYHIICSIYVWNRFTFPNVLPVQYVLWKYQERKIMHNFCWILNLNDGQK